MFLAHRKKKNKTNFTDERRWSKKTSGENTLSKGYQSLFRREDMEVSVSQMEKEAAIHLNVVEELSFLLSRHTVPWCLDSLLSSHLGISVVDMVLTGCFAFKGWEKLILV